MDKKLVSIEKGVNEMGTGIRSGNEARIDRRKGVSDSPIIQQDINCYLDFTTFVNNDGTVAGSLNTEPCKCQ